MKKFVLLFALIACVLLFGCGATGKENDASEQDDMTEKIENAMYEVLGDDLKKCPSMN